MLEEPGHSLDAVYFPQSGLISLIVQMPEDSTVEVGTVGSEGAIGRAVSRFFHLRLGSGFWDRPLRSGVGFSRSRQPKCAHTGPDCQVL